MTLYSRLPQTWHLAQVLAQTLCLASCPFLAGCYAGLPSRRAHPVRYKLSGWLMLYLLHLWGRQFSPHRLSAGCHTGLLLQRSRSSSRWSLDSWKPLSKAPIWTPSRWPRSQGLMTSRGSWKGSPSSGPSFWVTGGALYSLRSRRVWITLIQFIKLWLLIGLHDFVS